MEKDDIYWMNIALELAQEAKKKGEVPVGAVIVGPEGLLAKSLNSRENLLTPLGHAELQALHEASQTRKSWRLNDCTLYVTLEPCIMCAGAIQQSRLARVVYGAKDPKAGAVDSLYSVLTDSRLNHQCEVTAGVLEKECSEILSHFFQNKRLEKKEELESRIYRERSTAIVFHENKILGFEAIDPTSGKDYFFLPGGGIEQNEKPFEGARRECLEETGYEIEIDSDTEFIREYPFDWNGKKYFCKTYFYLGFLKNTKAAPQVVQDADYNKGTAWKNTDKIEELFAYSPDIVWAVQKLFKLYKKKSVSRKK